MAVAVAVCILSPVPLLLLTGGAEYGKGFISGDTAGGIGVAVLLIMVACAVGIFISYGMNVKSYVFLEKERIIAERGVKELAETRRREFFGAYRGCIIGGVMLCILSMVPLMTAWAFQASDLIYVYLTALLLVLIACGVMLFVWAGMIYGSFQALLEEGDYSRKKKRQSRKNESFSRIYWSLATAIYLGLSFLTNKWETTWILWPIAGVLYAAVIGAINIARGYE